ncbi:DSBA-like thioredoxin domain protein [Tsuneonella dongtanensis]|uniref:DSBA-like thioredoxin domain protein n=1 Tax=Tsuneonella dongtanensis TaxID=692370 RepID=A0A1B2ADX4_9SPHN|nr:thioredoxin domain-containing protein [Tsuneonella dongtanensis]ANY20337.1 DSBA-like thioredoxin domain protein [Tsuneonella dongtanensis]
MLRTASFALVAALALASCGSNNAADGEVAEGAPVAAVAAPTGQAWIDVASVTPDGGYMVGNPDAPIKLMEYGSLTCGACANFTQTGFETLRDKYINTGKVSFELRNQVHNGIDLVLARLVRCSTPDAMVPLSEQVWMNFDTIMTGAQAAGPQLEAAMALPESQRFVAVAQASGLLPFFASRGISEDQARTCLADAKSVEAIAERSDKQSEELNVTGTPTFFVNGSNVGTQSWETLEPMLQRAGAR